MSVNDLLDSEELIPAMLVIFVLIMLIAVPIGIATSKRTNNNIYGDDDYTEAEKLQNARILAKRTAPHPLNQNVMINLIVFELADGNRVELAIKDASIFGVMVEGDCGVLKYQGKKFISFVRGNCNEI